VGQRGPCVGCGKMVTVPEPPKKPDAAQPVNTIVVRAEALKSSKVQPLLLILRAVGLTLGIAMAAAIAIYLFWPSLKGLKNRRDAIACMNNLQTIAEALRSYAADHGTYPTPIVTDSAGKPLYSWRVLILPYLGESNLHARFKLNEPWNSPSNSQLIPECPLVFISPAVGGKRVTECNYVLLTGKGTIFPPTGPLKPSGVTDGLDKTLLVVETDNGTNEWSKPFDIDVSKMNGRIGASGPTTIGGTHAGGATVVFADGTSAWLPDDMPFALLDAAITAQGNEGVEINAESLKFK
jgi:prepilin-type processing-associated H-X9-DG protein